MALGVYMLLKSWEIDVETFNWVPVTSFSWCIFVSSLGLQFVTIIIMVEIMPEQIKVFGVSSCMTLLWIFGFLNVKFLPTVIEGLGLHFGVFIFAGVSLCCAIFTVVFIPETRMKSHDEIMELLEKKIQL